MVQIEVILFRHPSCIYIALVYKTRLTFAGAQVGLWAVVILLDFRHC